MAAPTLSITPGLQALRRGNLYFGGAQRAATASNHSYLQLFNPAGSGKLVTCISAVVNTNSTSNVVVGRFDTELTTKVLDIASSVLGGSVGVCDVRTQISTTTPGTLLDDIIINNLQGVSSYLIPFVTADCPIIIPSGS
jgi:hypothetical protein